MAAKKTHGDRSSHKTDLTQHELQDWDRIAPVGREFGSPDYERLAELDHLAIKSRGSLAAARRWLDTPNQALRGQTPEDVARTSEGYAQVIHLLSSPGKYNMTQDNVKVRVAWDPTVAPERQHPTVRLDQTAGSRCANEMCANHLDISEERARICIEV